MSERRRIDRLGPLVIRTEYPRGKGLRHGYLTNLSEGGAFLATDDDLSIDENLRLHFVLPWGLGDHVADVVIIWRTRDMDGDDAKKMPAGVGLSFTHIDSGARQGIRRYTQKFLELLEQIEREGVNEVLEKLTKEPSGKESIR